MDHHIYVSLLLTTIATVCFFFLTTLPQSHSQPIHDTKYSECSHPFNCGWVFNLNYPFWEEKRPRYCGGSDQFKLINCETSPEIHFGSQSFHVLHIDTNNYTMKMFRTGLLYDNCSGPLTNNSLNHALFRYTQSVYNIFIFYDCPPGVSYDRNYFTCLNDRSRHAFYVEETQLHQFPDLQKCGHRIQVQALQGVLLDPDRGIDALRETLEHGFDVTYTTEDAQECKTCLESSGLCGSNDTSNYEFSCHCPDGSDASSQCPNNKSNKWKWGKRVIIGVASAVGAALVVSMGFIYYNRRKKSSYAMSYIQSQSMSTDPSLKDTEKGSQYFGVHLFTYSELEEATNYFDSSRELGDGGFGTVYYGVLRDGRCVAVKRLYENNCRRVEQFMNEIEILTRLRHQNLVSLYGCTSRHSRELLLVYEYIPNGTVADHLHGERAKPGTTLPWHIRMNIAVETASALQYLHAHDIIHRDVKTNNILLDNHFCVKVADFGLSRLFPTDVTHVSTAPQGTPGYVDPEYHEIYQLTDKSDVYSFGVVLIELISSLPAVDITRHRHEVNLANMAINKIHNQALHELVDPALGFESDYKVRKMTNAVAELAFQCLQSSRDMRPSMEGVLDTLKDIQSGDKSKSQPEVMDISGSADDVVLLKDDPPPPSPDSNAVSKSTTPNASG